MYCQGCWIAACVDKGYAFLSKLREQFIWLILIFFLSACHHQPHNNPYPSRDDKANVYYGAFSTPPKTLDPAKSYTVNEAQFISLIYETPLEYHYLKRPWALKPLLAEGLPQIRYLDAQGLPTLDRLKAKSSEYIIHIRPGIYYQPHPALARDTQGQLVYAHLSPAQAQHYHQISDFTQTGTRELTADDFVYEIKRLASPQVQSPIYGLMSGHIMDLAHLRARLEMQMQKNPKTPLDLRDYSFSGAEVLDRYTYRIRLSDPYPQFMYWLAMSFFAPYPWEADRFYSQPGFAHQNISIDWVPIGTGPYQLSQNNPNALLQLIKNPNFHREKLPQGLAHYAGEELPKIQGLEFYSEKESIPRWNKFLQGYYDQSGIGSDSFDAAIAYNAQGLPELKPKLRDQGIKLQISTEPSIFYLGFNWQDPIVGGADPKAQKLRQALSIAIDMQEYIQIFLNGRGQLAQGPLPPGIWGAKTGSDAFNPFIFKKEQGQVKRRSLAEAQKLLTEAGYPNGIDVKTGKPLKLTLSIASDSRIDEGTLYTWFIQQFAKLNIELNIESTTYNRFQDKLNSGATQIFFSGWLADYPDPENFLFLLYGPNGKVKYGGENISNYQNADFDREYLAMSRLRKGPERQAEIDRMVAEVQEDAPWIWGFYPVSFQLSQPWVFNNHANPLVNNALKYMALDPEQRFKSRLARNKLAVWPLWLMGLTLGLIMVCLWYLHRQQKNKKPASISIKGKGPLC